MFALDADLVVQLLSSFEGRQIYPETVSKEDVFIAAAEEHQAKRDRELVPEGEYYLSNNVKGFGTVSATMRVESGSFIVLRGCRCAPARAGWIPEVRRTAPIVNDILSEDVSTTSPSMASWVVLGQPRNGWYIWKDKNGNVIDSYRKNK